MTSQNIILISIALLVGVPAGLLYWLWKFRKIKGHYGQIMKGGGNGKESEKVDEERDSWFRRLGRGITGKGGSRGRRDPTELPAVPTTSGADSGSEVGDDEESTTTTGNEDVVGESDGVQVPVTDGDDDVEDVSEPDNRDTKEDWPEY